MNRFLLNLSACFLWFLSTFSLDAAELPIRWFTTSVSIRTAAERVLQEATPNSATNRISLPPPSSPQASIDASATSKSASDQFEIGVQWYRYLNSRPMFTPPEKRETDGVLRWAANQIYAMETVKVRNVRVTGSFVTAIKRKNPLCLLNPRFLSW